MYLYLATKKYCTFALENIDVPTTYALKYVIKSVCRENPHRNAQCF